MSRGCRVLLTGFEAFGGLSANPTARSVRRLSRDRDLRRAGLRTSVLPVDREEAPRRLAALLRRHRPQALVLTGVAIGRSELCFERTAVNVWQAPGDRGLGRPIRPGGPDGLFATAPIAAALRALRRGGPARISESAGTYACNLVLYEALRWSREGPPWGGPAPRWSCFVHVPATPDCAPDPSTPTLPETALDEALKALCADLAARVRA